MAKEIKYLLGEQVRMLRVQRGLSQEELGEKAGLHHTYIGSVERGEKNCSIATLDKLARGLEVSISDLMNFAGQREDLEKLRKDIVADVNTAAPEVLKLVSGVLKGVRGLTGKKRQKRSQSGDR